MKKEASIGIVLPYFGKLPDCFPLFLESVKNNPTIDWILYTDDDSIQDYPSNVKLHKISFEEFKEKLQESYDFPICVNKPYKLCDFKPTWGETLKEDLRDYDFWGCCDCDLIFGNIRKFITKQVTDKYQKILECGHLILWRNVSDVNEYYRIQQYIDYRTVLGSEENFVFDEERGIGGFWRNDNKLCWRELCYDDICVGNDDFRITKSIPGGFIGPYLVGDRNETQEFQKMKNIIYAYSKGTLKRMWIQRGKIHTEEVLYVHLQKRKMCVEDGLKYEAGFLIVPNSFIGLTELTVKEHKTLAPGRFNLRNYLRLWYEIATCEMKFWGSAEWKEKSAIKFIIGK